MLKQFKIAPKAQPGISSLARISTWISRWRWWHRLNHSPDLVTPGTFMHTNSRSRSRESLTAMTSQVGHLPEARLVPKARMISISKTWFSLKTMILLHNGASKKICSIRYDAYLYLLSWKSRKHSYLILQNSTRSRPPKAADFFGSLFFVFSRDVSWTSKIKDIDKPHI